MEIPGLSNGLKTRGRMAARWPFLNWPKLATSGHYAETANFLPHKAVLIEHKWPHTKKNDFENLPTYHNADFANSFIHVVYGSYLV